MEEIVNPLCVLITVKEFYLLICLFIFLLIGKNERGPYSSFGTQVR